MTNIKNHINAINKEAHDLNGIEKEKKKIINELAMAKYL